MSHRFDCDCGYCLGEDNPCAGCGRPDCICDDEVIAMECVNCNHKGIEHNDLDMISKLGACNIKGCECPEYSEDFCEGEDHALRCHSFWDKEARE